jgi:hypothetical protein
MGHESSREGALDPSPYDLADGHVGVASILLVLVPRTGIRGPRAAAT